MRFLFVYLSDYFHAKTTRSDDMIFGMKTLMTYTCDIDNGGVNILGHLMSPEVKR